MRRTLPRLALLAVAAALAAAVVAGCGGGDSGGGTDLTKGLSAQELLTRSAAEAAKLDTFRIALDGTATVGLAPGAGGAAAGLLNGPVTFSGEGPVDPPDKASVDLTVKLPSFSPQVNLTRVGDAVYVGILGQDFQLALPASTVRLLDFGRLYPTLTGWISDPRRSPGEDINGDPTVKVTGKIDAQKALADLGPILSGSGVALPRAQAVRALEQGTVEAWIGTQDLRPRRVHLVLKVAGLTGAGVPVRSADVDLTATLSAFDEPVDITAPANAKPLDLKSLGSLTGP